MKRRAGDDCGALRSDVGLDCVLAIYLKPWRFGWHGMTFSRGGLQMAVEVFPPERWSPTRTGSGPRDGGTASRAMACSSCTKYTSGPTFDAQHSWDLSIHVKGERSSKGCPWYLVAPSTCCFFVWINTLPCLLDLQELLHFLTMGRTQLVAGLGTCHERAIFCDQLMLIALMGRRGIHYASITKTSPCRA